MWPFILLAGLIGGVALSGKAPPGMQPRDILPPGFDGPHMATERVTASSGQLYDVLVWKPNGQNLQYFVAKLVGFRNSWMGYILDRLTGERKFFRAHCSSDAELAKLKSDFKVTR